MHIYVHIHVCMCMHVYAGMNIYLHLCMYVSMYIYIYIYSHPHCIKHLKQLRPQINNSNTLQGLLWVVYIFSDQPHCSSLVSIHYHRCGEPTIYRWFSERNHGFSTATFTLSQPASSKLVLPSSLIHKNSGSHHHMFFASPLFMRSRRSKTRGQSSKQAPWPALTLWGRTGQKFYRYPVVSSNMGNGKSPWHWGY